MIQITKRKKKISQKTNKRRISSHKIVYIARCLLEVRMRFSKLPLRIRLRWSSAGRVLVERWSSKDRVLTWDFCLKNDNHGRYFTRV